MAAGHSDNFHHVRDFGHFELPGQYHLDLPVIFGLQITKFMVLQLVAVVFLFLVFRGLAKRAADRSYRGAGGTSGNPLFYICEMKSSAPR